MASDPPLDPTLMCSICPTKPSFSDVSHLLTHVGSKSHLANLHKIQIQSQYDKAAGDKLTIYNDWYMLNGLAAQLSIRQVQKEGKKASKHVNKGRIKTEVGKIEDNTEETVPIRSFAASRSTRGAIKRATRIKVYQDEDSDETYKSSQDARCVDMITMLNKLTDLGRRPHTSAYDSPLSISTSDVATNVGNIDPGLNDKDALRTPKNAKLKGTIWPGMALYESATTEAAKRRNQKKDGSVVRQMKTASGLVERKESVHELDYEVTYNDNGNRVWIGDWNKKRERDIDELDDTSSLIEGETPIPKRAARGRKRKALGVISGNIPRMGAKRTIKEDYDASPTRRPVRAQTRVASGGDGGGQRDDDYELPKGHYLPTNCLDPRKIKAVPVPIRNGAAHARACAEHGLNPDGSQLKPVPLGIGYELEEQYGLVEMMEWSQARDIADAREDRAYHAYLESRRPAGFTGGTSALEALVAPEAHECRRQRAAQDLEIQRMVDETRRQWDEYDDLDHTLFPGLYTANPLNTTGSGQMAESPYHINADGGAPWPEDHGQEYMTGLSADGTHFVANPLAQASSVRSDPGLTQSFEPSLSYRRGRHATVDTLVDPPRLDHNRLNAMFNETYSNNNENVDAVVTGIESPASTITDLDLNDGGEADLRGWPTN